MVMTMLVMLIMKIPMLTITTMVINDTCKLHGSYSSSNNNNHNYTDGDNDGILVLPVSS